MSYKPNVYSPGGPPVPVAFTAGVWTTVWDRTLAVDESLSFDMVIKIVGGTPKRMATLRVLFSAYRDGANPPRLTADVLNRSEDLPSVTGFREQSIGADIVRFQIRVGATATYEVSTRSLEL